MKGIVIRTSGDAMVASKNVIIVDDSSNGSQIRQSMVSHGWTVHHASALGEASTAVDACPNGVGLLFLNVSKLPNVIDVETLVGNQHIRWIALVDQPPHRDSILSQLLCHMFFAYHVLPIDMDQLECLLKHAFDMAQLEIDNCHHISESNPFIIQEMVGTTPIINKLFNTIRKVALVDAPVFISGESGTGKEMTAQAIHTQSFRAKGPFNAVNCGALPSNLIQSELFGHEKGAFTGATQRRIGRIEATSGGTLFLDEIGDLPLDMQVNLLRFLENHKIQRVGSLDEIAVDVRVLAATHVDLVKAVSQERFREDLYHRLNVLQVDIPPLRERRDDIELLAQFFFKKFSDEKPLRVRGFSQEALTLLRQHEWPGNVRELINRIRRAMVMCESRLIMPADLGLERRQCTRSVITLDQARDNAERDVIKSALARNKNKIQYAAKELGISRVTLYRLIEKHSILRGKEKTASVEEEPSTEKSEKLKKRTLPIN